MSDLRGRVPRRAFEIGLGLTVSTAVFAIGSVHFWPLAVLTLCSGTLALGVVWRGTKLGGAEWTLVGLSMFSFLQAVPLPASVVSTIAPANAAVWIHGLDPAGLPAPRWFPVSLDPGASIRESMRWFSYACILTTSGYVALRRGANWAVKWLFGIGCALAAVTLAHELLRAESVYGIYRPRFATSRWNVGPLLNPNNLAGALLLCMFPGIALASKAERGARWAYATGVAGMLAVILLSASRAGVAAMPIGLACLLLLQRRWDLEKPRRTLMTAVSVALLGLAFAFMGSTEASVSELINDQTGKLKLFSWVVPMLDDHLWVGVGRGAFEAAFGPYRQGGGARVFSHAENFVLQWLVEWGVFGALAALAAFGTLIRRARPGSYSGGILAGAAAFFVQNLFDLGLEIPGLVALLCFGLGGVRRLRTSKRSKQQLPVLLIAGGGALGFGTATGRTDLHQARDDLHASYEKLDVSKPTDVDAFFERRVNPALLQYPGDAYVLRMGALVAFRSNRNPVPWLQAALRRDPMSGRTHLLVASVLEARGFRTQAMLELKFAAERDAQIVSRLGRRLALIARDPDEFRRHVPEGPNRVRFLTGASEERGPLGVLALRLLLDDQPQNQERRFVLGSRLMDNWEREEPPCAPPADLECLSQVERLAEEMVDSRDRSELRARIALAKGNPLQARSELLNKCPATYEALGCCRISFRATLEAEVAGAGEAADHLLLAACRRPNACALEAEQIGDAFAARKRHLESLKYYQRAATTYPSRSRWLKVGKAAERIGAKSTAQLAERRAKALE